MSEKPAKGTRGFLLHNPVTQGFFFWVYDPADKSKFVDYEPSSKCCHRCGWKDKDQTLSDRVFRCECCGLEMDRDLNAAKNILQIGKRQILSDGQEFTLGDERSSQPVEGSASRRAKKKQCVALIG